MLRAYALGSAKCMQFRAQWHRLGVKNSSVDCFKYFEQTLSQDFGSMVIMLQTLPRMGGFRGCYEDGWMSVRVGIRL